MFTFSFPENNPSVSDDETTDFTDLMENLIPTQQGLIQDLTTFWQQPWLTWNDSVFLFTSVQPWRLKFSRKEIQHFKLQYLQMTRSELDIAILAKLFCAFIREAKQKDPKCHNRQSANVTELTTFTMGRKFAKLIHSVGLQGKWCWDKNSCKFQKATKQQVEELRY